MAGVRPFKGLRYTGAAGALGSLLSAASGTLTPNGRSEYAVRNPNNAISFAHPEGSSDDRSKYIRYARASAAVAGARREGILAAETTPAFYRLSQQFGHFQNGDPVSHTTLLAIGNFDDVAAIEVADPRIKEERLRLLEATRTTFESAVAYYEDPTGEALTILRKAPASSEISIAVDNVVCLLETIDDPDAVSAITAAFSSKSLMVADGVEGFEAAREFRESIGERSGWIPEDGAFLALTSLDEAFARLSVHRVVRRFPGGIDQDAVLARLATRFEIEEHHNRNLETLMEQARHANQTVFGMATEGGRGYLLTPTLALDTPASIWLQREVFAGLFGITPNDAVLYFEDPIQAVRAANEGAAAAFLLPRPQKSDLVEAQRLGLKFPHRSSYNFPGVPTGLVMWAMGDDA